MNRVKILLSICVLFSSEAMAVSTKEPETTNQEIGKADQTDQTDNLDQEESDPDLVKAVEDALNAVKRESPQVNEDSLRVWKNFKSSSKPVNYTYRFWGRRLILWLKDEKKMAFQSEQEVGEVFKVLWRKGLISKNAVVVLMVDAWSHLVYLEGSPSWEKRMENRSPQGGTAPASPQGDSSERST